MIPAGSAGTTIKTFTATINPSPAPGGSSVTLTLTLTNTASNQQLGSVNVVPPTGFTITNACSGTTTSPCTPLPSGSSTSFPISAPSALQLRNLSIAPGVAKSFAIQATTPCGGTGFQWELKAKQSNDFNGPPGNNFTPFPNYVNQALSGTCNLVWDVQPASAFVNELITGTAYTPTAANKVTVKAVGGDGVTVIPVSGLAVTLYRTPGTGIFTSPGTGFAVPGLTANLSNGYATFTSFTSDRTGTGFKFYATATGFNQSPDSGAFDIDEGTSCSPGEDPCDTGVVPLGSAVGQASGTGGSFNFIAINTVDFGTPAGCQYFSTVDQSVAPIVVKDGRTSATGELFVTYGIDKTLIKKKYGNNQGQQFIPICVGAKRIIEVGGVTQAVPCNQKYNGVDQTGWWGKDLNSDGTFNGGLRQAVCDTNSGYFFSIVGSFQDYTNSDPTLKIDPSWNPTVQGWNTPETDAAGCNSAIYRCFLLRFPASSGPASTPFAQVPWDAWGHG